MIKRATQIENGEYQSKKWLKGQSFELENAIVNGESSQRVNTILKQDIYPLRITDYVRDFGDIVREINTNLTPPPSLHSLEPAAPPEMQRPSHSVAPDLNDAIFETREKARKEELESMKGTGIFDQMRQQLEPKQPEPVASPQPTTPLQEALSSSLPRLQEILRHNRPNPFMVASKLKLKIFEICA